VEGRHDDEMSGRNGRWTVAGVGQIGAQGRQRDGIAAFGAGGSVGDGGSSGALFQRLECPRIDVHCQDVYAATRAMVVSIILFLVGMILGCQKTGEADGQIARTAGGIDDGHIRRWQFVGGIPLVGSLEQRRQHVMKRFHLQSFAFASFFRLRCDGLDVSSVDGVEIRMDGVPMYFVSRWDLQGGDWFVVIDEGGCRGCCGCGCCRRRW